MVSVDGILCCLGAAVLLYFIARSHGREADALNSVTRVNKLKNLDQLFDAASKVLPLVVAVSGRVGSDKLINCEKSGLRVVVLERTIEQQYEKQNDAVPCKISFLFLPYPNTCMHFVMDDGTGRVDVLGARGARGFVLTVGSDVFEKSRRETIENVPDFKILGIREVERVLAAGKLLTVVCEVVKDDLGSIRIQRPHNGLFYVSDKNIDELITSSGSYARFLRYASVGLAVLGIYLLAKHPIQHKQERRRRKRVINAAKKSEKEEAGLNYKAKNESDCTSRDRARPDLCVICLEHEYNSVFVPCGHMCCCVTCSSHLINCPLCRRWIEQVVRTFRH